MYFTPPFTVPMKVTSFMSMAIVLLCLTLCVFILYPFFSRLKCVAIGSVSQLHTSIRRQNDKWIPERNRCRAFANRVFNVNLAPLTRSTFLFFCHLSILLSYANSLMSDSIFSITSCFVLHQPSSFSISLPCCCKNIVQYINNASLKSILCTR